MSGEPQPLTPDMLVHAAGSLAIVVGIISLTGIVFLVAMFICFAKSLQSLGATFGMINDICVALQYLLTIPIALALAQVLRPYNPAWIRFGTILGILMMLIITGAQLALVLGLVAFEQEVVWVTPAMILGVGTWLMITGVVSRATGSLPHSVLMSSLAVPYLGYPVWAFWLGWHLVGW